MSYETETAARYRVYAEELRTIAATMLNTEHRKQLLTIAVDYEQLAQQMEQIDKTNVRLQKRPLG